MKRWLRNILALVIVCGLAWYLWRHWDRLGGLLRLRTTDLALILLATLGANVAIAANAKVMLAGLGARGSLAEMWTLENAATLLNYLPMKAGTVLRANYLKRRYGLAYSRFGAFFIQRMLLMTATAAGIGLVVLPVVYGLDRWEEKVLAGVFAGGLLAAGVLLLAPLPAPRSDRRVWRLLAAFLDARRTLSRHGGVLAASTGLFVVNFLLFAVRIGLVYRTVGAAPHPAGFLVLGSLASLMSLLSLTPGSLGIRELALGAGAVVLGVPPEVGVLAAVVDRAVALAWAFAVGGGCAVRLWRRSPGAFRQPEDAPTDRDAS